jgi:diaminopimelate epimerase
MHIPFTKMHGTGNVILVVDQREQNLPPPSSETIRRLGNDTSDISFDQIMWVAASREENCVASYRIFNRDGSEAEQCGNGVRCVARYLATTDGELQEFALQSPAGLISARVFPDGQVAVSMGAPQFEPSRIPFVADRMADFYPLRVDEEEFRVCAVSMGNPHCILMVNDVAAARVDELGPKIEHHDRFPERTNVGFMRIADRENIELRVHERGAGETAACGTGACAAVATGRRLGLLEETVSVSLPGGKVVVSWRGGDTAAWLKGNAEVLSDGMMNL